MTYVYYHCSRKNKEIECHEPPITEKDLFNQIYQQFIALQPPEEFILWAKKWISYLHKEETSNQESILESQNANVEILEKKLNRLVDMRINDEIDEETYKKKKSKLEKEKIRAKDNLETIDGNLVSWRTRVEKAIDLAYGGYLKFKTGNREERHEMLLSIGSNLCVEQRNMRIDLSIHFQEFEDSDNWSKKYKDWVEPQKYTDLFEKRPDLRPPIPVWLPRQVVTRTKSWVERFLFFNSNFILANPN